MSITYGFYNSKNHDRRYDMVQMSSIFDGIIRDGILQHIGTAMMVKEAEGMTVNVGIGRAWFNHTWTLNDSVLPLTVPLSEVVLNRIDAVVIDVNANEDVRANDIKVITGTPASSPAKPSMAKEANHWQYPLAYIYVGAGVASIRQANITNCVGTSECPFVTAPLEKMSIDDLVAQWGDQWEMLFEGYRELSSADYDALTEYMTELERLSGQQYDSLFARIKEFEGLSVRQYAALETYITNFKTSSETDFRAWFDSLKTILDDDELTSLINLVQSNVARITAIESALFNDITANPYSIMFDDLDGVQATGVWNATLQRIEC